MKHYGIWVEREGFPDGKQVVGHLLWEEAFRGLIAIAKAFGEHKQAQHLAEEEQPGAPSSIEVVGADKDDLFTVVFSIVETE